MLTVSARATKLSSLAALTATGGPLAGVKVHLFQNNIIPGPGTQLTDFVDATFDGYAAQAAGTWGAPYYGPDGNAHVTAPGLQFQPTGSTTPNTIYGAYYTNTAGSALVGAVKFDNSIPMIDPTTGFVFEPDWMYGV